ncbi:MAG: peptidoglycan DD-metalloendopeptidase family protein [bacterium]|nr:peptidoglycan DD-metalloendopeptidase family protein [bacterium]
MKVHYKSLCAGLFVVLSLSASVQADELILEWDPDEGGREELGMENEGGEKFLEGYRHLFEFKQDEISGLEAVMLPIRQDMYSLDTQLQVLGLQSTRFQQQQQLVLQKQQGLMELTRNLQVQIQLVALELKDILAKFQDMVALVYRIKLNFLTEDGKLNLSQLFAGGQSPAELLFQDYLVEGLQRQLLQQFSVVASRQLQLFTLREQADKVQIQLQLYQARLSQSADVAQQQLNYKQQLLGQKRREQQFFQEQLEEVRREQALIHQRIQELAQGVTKEEYQQFPEEAFQWPVAPVLGISAGFHESGYFERFGIHHNAVDIPTDQLTPVRAPLSGRVIQVHDGGQTGYSFLQLAHKNNISTVYGHVYSFQVEEGEEVRQGQVIALSGGAIGTKGAGRLTTGPHLHLEVWKNGVAVDPRGYLPKLAP